MELIGDPWGEYHYEIKWRKPPKWYKGWVKVIDKFVVENIFNYLLKNKELLEI